MNFLSGMLREEGGLEYKASIADTIIAIIEENPEAKEIGWLYLDYVFYNISIKIIKYLIDVNYTLFKLRNVYDGNLFLSGVDQTTPVCLSHIESICKPTVLRGKE